MIETEQIPVIIVAFIVVGLLYVLFRPGGVLLMWRAVLQRLLRR
jgi:hypothetical protein